MSDSKRILVTGGTGYIGNFVVEKLLAHGHEVRVLDSCIFGEAGVDRLRDKPGLSLIPGDIRHIEDLVVGLKGCDVCIHLAAIVGDKACQMNPDATRTVNVEATKVLVELCRHYGVRRLVFASSCSVYGANRQALLNEGSVLNPLSLYAETRVESENIILNAAGGLFETSPEGVIPTILRFGTLFGYSARMRFDLAVNILTARAITEGVIPVYGGDQSRPFLHVQDAADAVVTVAQASEELVRRQIFNVSDASLNLQIKEVGALISGEFSEAKLDFVPHQEDHRNYTVSCEKINEVLGWQTTLSLKDGVAEIADAFKAGGVSDYREDHYYNSNYEYL